MGEALYVSEGKLLDRDGNRQTLDLPSGSSIGGVAVTAVDAAVNTWSVDGVFLTAHDALYAYAQDMKGSAGSTYVDEIAQDVGFPRWSLPDAATNRVKWIWAIPAAWGSIAVRFAWCKEAAGSGNVVWQYAYRLVYPFTGEDVDASAVTTVALGPKAVSGTTFGLQYEIPSEIQNIATPDGAFGSKPFLLSSLTRLGGDGSDNYAAAAAVLLATLTRIS